MPRPPILPFLVGALSLIAAHAPAQELNELIEEGRLELDASRADLWQDIGEFGSAEAFEALQSLVKAVRHPITRGRIAEAFSEFRATELEEDAVELLLDWALGKDLRLAITSTRSLGEFDAASAKALDRVLNRGRSDEVRAVAVGQLLDDWRSDPSAERIKLFIKYARSPESGTRGQLLRFLARVPDEQARTIYLDLIDDERLPTDSRAWLVQDLSERAEAVAGPALSELLTGKHNEQLQARALECLLDRDLKAPLQVLRKKSRTAKDPALRLLASLARDRQEEQAGAWAEEIRRWSLSSDPLEQRIAASLFSSLVQEERPEALRRLMLVSSDLVVHSELVRSVALLREAELVGILIELLDESRPALYARADRALVQLTHARFMDNAAEWQEWWQEQRASGQPILPQRDARADMFQSSWEIMREAPDGSLFGIEPKTQGLLFVVDTSAWMERLTPIEIDGTTARITGLEVVRRHLAAALNRLPDGTEVGLLCFDGEVRSWRPKLVKLSRRTRDEMADYLAEIVPGAGAQLYEALQASFAFPDVDTLVVFSGGEPRKSAVVDPDLILADVRRWNRFRHLTVHTVSLFVESDALRELARETKGRAVVAQ
jgi:hypothetical protein